MTTTKLDYDVIKWHPKVRVVKYDKDTVQDIVRMIGHEPSGAELRELEETQGLLSCADFAYADGNLLVTVGLNNITANMIGSGTTMTNAHTIVGVGSVSTTAVIGDTHLGGDTSTSTAYYQQADATYPSQSNGVLTCNCTYGTGNANFAWQEWCFAVGTGTITAGGTLASVATGVVMINHKVQSLGTKASGSTWTLQATVTLS